MILTLDFGNTRCKIAAFKDGDLIAHDIAKKHNVNQLEDFVAKNNGITQAIYCSVANESKEVSDYLDKHFQTTVFTAKTPIPIRNNYQSPETLGIDRLATAVGGATQYPNQNLLIIDAGSAITYDFIDKNQGFMGGSISPGLTMRYKALNTFTENLPLVKQQNNVQLIENTTEMAISAGVQNGVIAEMNGIIDRFRGKYEDLQIIGTGGDLNFFNNKLKSHIFADSFLLLKGLNRVIEYNA